MSFEKYRLKIVIDGVEYPSLEQVPEHLRGLLKSEIIAAAARSAASVGALRVPWLRFALAAAALLAYFLLNR